MAFYFLKLAETVMRILKLCARMTPRVILLSPSRGEKRSQRLIVIE